jgi:exodeoxyribonuclease V beta subunit
MTSLTSPAQFDLLAANLDGKTLIEASAGTGKTFNISGLYLRLLLEKDCTVDQILVVTFTKAATAELRERIRSRIVDLLDALRADAEVSDAFLVSLLQHLRQLGKERDALVQTLDLALQSFDAAAICTIHAFCQRALAESPFAAGMPFTAEITQDDSQELAEAVNDFWRARISTQSDLPLVRYLLERGDTPQKYQALLRRHVGKPGVQVAWPAPCTVDVAVTQAQMEELFAQTCESWQAGCEALRAVLEGANLKASHNAEKLAEAFAECARYLAGDAHGKCGAKAKLLSASKVKAATRVGMDAPEHPLLAQLEALFTTLPALLENCELALQVQRLELIREMLETGRESLARSKRDKRLLSYDDLLCNLHGALCSPQTPWLAGSLRQRFPVALIDEFQDTDPLQFDIFSRIYPGPDAPLFLVGDPKQAIYSFRNADLHTYLHARQDVQSLTTLADNQRSSAGLIAAMNALFESNPRAFLLDGLDYHPVNFGAKPRLHFEDRSAAGADLEVWLIPEGDQGPLDRGAAMRMSTRATAAEIARLIAEGAAGNIDFAERHLQPGDIAVLVRSHSQAAKIRDALAAQGVASIEISQESVYASSDAADIETLLTALLEPTRQGLMLAALATPFFARSAAEIVAIAADDSALSHWNGRFLDCREAWLRHGLGYMLRRLMEEEGVNARMLARADGERRMTNLRHLAEALQQAQQSLQSPEAALAWLQARRRDPGADESAQLRLESDRELVQILTIHKSKGLEYPVVFCPYLWDGYPAGGSDLEGNQYHDEQGRPLIDFRLDEASRNAAESAMREESHAEALRLIYVALTRASHRCIIVAGPYSRKTGRNVSVKESGRAMLNWLVCPEAVDGDTWHDKPLPPERIRQLWQDYASRCPQVLLRALDDIRPVAAPRAHASTPQLAARTSARPLFEDWRNSSFTSLASGLADAAPADHDSRVQSPRALNAAPAELDANDILLFARGSEAGHCLHTLFELADFCDPDTWPAAIEQALQRHPQPVHTVSLERQRAMLRALLSDVLASTLPGGIRLAQVPMHERLNELEFSFPAQGVAAAELNGVLKRHGYDIGALAFPSLRGYFNGFIDLVYQHDGRFYVLDWKSNHLGYQPQDYGPQGLADAMREHGYCLQYLVYVLALDRYLAQRIPDYRYETHFGGVHYLFLRGVRPGWQHAEGPCGVVFDRPTSACMQALSALFGEAAAREAA